MPGIPVLIILLHCYSVYDLFETKILGLIFIFRSILIGTVQVILNNADNQAFFDISIPLNSNSLVLSCSQSRKWIFIFQKFRKSVNSFKIY